MTPTQLQALAVPVQALEAQISDAAPTSGESDDLRAANVNAAQSFARAVDSWAGPQAAQVLQGTRGQARWAAYGNELLARGKEFLGQLRDSSGWLGRVLYQLGAGAAAGLDAIAAKVTALQAEVRAVSALRDAVLDRSLVLQRHLGDLSAEALDALSSEARDAADASWRRLSEVVDGLSEVVASVRSGRWGLQPTQDGQDFAVVTYSGMGAFPVALGILAAVAIAWALALAVRAYYVHADEVTRAEISRLQLGAVASGQISGAELVALKASEAAADKARQPELDLLSMAGRVVVGGALAVGGVFAAVKLAEWLFRRRAQA